jgi:phage shock protein A
MALLNRFTRLLRADVHAVLDQLEEPTTLLRQSLREMEEEVARGDAELQAAQAQQAPMQARHREVTTFIARLGGELDLAFGAGSESLARGLLRRRLEHERLAQHLEQRLAGLAEAITQQRRALDAQRDTLEGLRQKAALFDIAAAASTATTETLVTDADVELAWLRERQQRSAS